MKVTRKPGEPITMEFIRAKSHEDGDCLIWDGGKGSDVPYMRVPNKRALIPVRRWIAINHLGLKVDGLLASNKCGNPHCVDPAHIKMMTRKQLQQFTTSRTKYQQNPARNYKLALAARARSPHSPELIEKIRNMEGTSKGIARELGINFSVVTEIRMGRSYKAYTNNPWAGL